MDSRRKRSILNPIIPITPFFFIFLLTPFVSSTGVFKVHHKFFGQVRSLAAIKEHDSHRHRRLVGIDIPLGGDGSPSGTGLYYAKIGLGSPSKDYYVQVDTGSDILWINCIQCTNCHKKSGLGIPLTLYDPNESATAKMVMCEEDTCATMHPETDLVCSPNKLCEYRVRYADGSQTDGYFVRDYLQYNKASGNGVTSPGNGTIVFGCGAKQTGELGSDNQALDGILGFGQSNGSVLSQLASSGKVKKVFSHCLDAENGGGIFAVGEVVKPKVKSTPLIPNQAHYNVNLKEIEVGKTTLDLPTDAFETGDTSGTIIDSGTTLAYLPDVVYTPLIRAIMSSQPDLKIQIVQEQYQCFEYTGSVDDGFPTVTFHFEDSLTLTVYPREYLFPTDRRLTCIGWQNSALQPRGGKDMTLLGDLVLSNKLVVYDLENQVIGWTEYNCSSSIEVLDDGPGAAYSVGSHDLSSACILDTRSILILLLLSAMLHIVYL